MTARTVKTKAACAWAGVDPLVLNEALFNQCGPPVPVTIPGKARSFGADDLVRLKVWGSLKGAGFRPSVAKALTLRLCNEPSSPARVAHCGLVVECDVDSIRRDAKELLSC
jgi:hypothetical protein